MADDRTLGEAEFCYLTTTKRVSGGDHTIEIWFALHGRTALLLAGNHASDWIRNIQARPAVQLRIGAQSFAGHGRVITDTAEAQLARELVFAKYQPGSADDLREWQQQALPVAVDLEL